MININDNYVNKQVYELDMKNVNREVERLTRSVDKVVEKVDNMTITVEGHGKTIEYQSQTMTSFEKTVDKLVAGLDKHSQTLNRVDKETAVNNTKINFNNLLNWKSIGAMGVVIWGVLQVLIQSFTQ